MPKPDANTLEILRNIQTEIGAGMVLKLGQLSEAEAAHNNACERAKAIIENYKQGYGLFQMTRDIAARCKAKELAQPGEADKKGNF